MQRGLIVRRSSSSVIRGSARIRVLHIITALSTGGAEMMLLKLLSATREKYFQAVVSGKTEGTIGPKIKELDVAVHELRLNTAVLNPVRAFSLGSFVREFQPDLIQGWMYHGNLLATLAARSLRSRSPVPVIWNIRQSLYDISYERLLTRAVIRLGAFLSGRAAAIVCNSYTSAGQHRSIGYKAAKQTVIPNGFDCGVFYPNERARREVRIELGIASHYVLVGLIARYHPMKDHLGFLAAAAGVVRSHPTTCFVLVGNGVTNEQTTLAKFIREHQLQEHVFLLGERQDIARLTAAFDIACSASAWGEGFSNAIGEAMACGVPCVVTGAGDSAYIVGNTGLSVPPGDPAALAQAIIRLIECGPEHRHYLGLAARQRVEKEFSLPSIAIQYDELYRQLLTGKEGLCCAGLGDVNPMNGEPLG